MGMVSPSSSAPARLAGSGAVALAEDVLDHATDLGHVGAVDLDGRLVRGRGDARAPTPVDPADTGLRATGLVGVLELLLDAPAGLLEPVLLTGDVAAHLVRRREVDVAEVPGAVRGDRVLHPLDLQEQ